MKFADFLDRFGSSTRMKKKSHVFHQGEKGGKLYYVAKGVLKAYYVTAQGKEFVKSFIMEPNVIGSLSAATHGELNPFSLVCLEDCELIEIDFQQLRDTALENQEMYKTLLDILIQLAIKKERREYQFLCLSPEERYKLFKEETPELLNRVTQNDIARYLGITPVALSRIRSRLQ